jgi:spermidine/putrescine transport system ATP-binding protein
MRKGQIVQKGTPAEVYQNPTSRFVASFLAHANFIEATRDPTGLAATPFGILQAQSLLAEPTATLCIRPEDVEYPVTPACLNRVKGTVREVIYRGDHQEVWLDPQGLRFNVSGKTPVCIGEGIEVGLPAGNLRVLYE